MKEPGEGGKRVSRCLLLAGPTGVGKSAVALSLAERVEGEIISVDSMQVYRGLDVGTAKPGKEECEKVAHHLIDILDLSESFDASQFVEHATRAALAIEGRGHYPILCGGTGLYFRAWLEGLGCAPARDPRLRRVLEETPMETLLEELRLKDPDMYARIDRRNPRRVVRAVEVVRLTGRTFSEQRAAWHATPLAKGAAVGLSFIGLDRGVEDLDRRIEARVKRMFEAGLVEETRRLMEQGLTANPTAMQAIGYRQVVEHLLGKRTLDRTIELVSQRTRQFARRQRTWFQRQPEIRWVRIEADDPLEAVVETVTRRLVAG